MKPLVEVTVTIRHYGLLTIAAVPATAIGSPGLTSPCGFLASTEMVRAEKSGS